MERYLKFREEYSRFFYRGYDVEETLNELKITYTFEIEGLSVFTPTWTFPKNGNPEAKWMEDPLMEKMIFSLGMVELVSYWKITCSPQVVIEAGSLSEEQILWWKDLYFNGLGEFFYVNKITEADPEGFMEIVCPLSEEESAANSYEKKQDTAGAEQGVLVPVGGGKDSAVTLELLKGADVPVFAYIINPRGATIHTTESAKLTADHVISVHRTLDKRMLQLNKEGFLNGHTPFSALVAFSTVIAARMAGLSYIALSNESSANESTVQGSTVNHQYSKSFKFETDFHRYQTDYLPGSAYYFSMLRPLSEFQIAKYFAKQKQYHAIFRSCNAGSKQGIWCCNCPKCLFVYIILTPFLSQEELVHIFGENLLEKDSLDLDFRELTGIEENKPFECVGTRREVLVALKTFIARGGKSLLTERYKETIEAAPGELDEMLSEWVSENQVPEHFLEILKDFMNRA